MNAFQAVLPFLETLCREGKISQADFQFEPAYPLSKLTSFRTGGSAAVLFCEKETVLIHLIPFLKHNAVPYYILGNGSNVLAKDEGYDGLVVCLSRMQDVVFDGTRVMCACGVPITRLARLCRDRGLAGMEFFYGIPGTVGGAVFMNAGAYGGECRDILESVTFLDENGDRKTLPAGDLELSYRTSIFQRKGGVILSAVFSLQTGNVSEITQTMEEWMRRRVEKQPLDYPSAGSTFRRCEGHYTAQMIENAGLKGYTVGGAMVSPKHAGFIINYNNATSRDIMLLMEHIQKVLYEKEGVRIEREVRILE